MQRTFSAPAEAFDWLSAQTSVLAIQTGEYGPIAQCIAGIDIAIWDLCARKAQLPLWRYMGGERSTVKVYASGLNPTDPEKLAAQRMADGYQAFKLKIGFGQDRDLNNLKAMRDVIGNRPLMVDANQGWDLATASDMISKLSDFDVAWLEAHAKQKNSKIRHQTDEYVMADGRRILLLAEGRLVNLGAAEGHPASVMDMSFSDQALTAEYLVKEAKNLPAGVHNVPTYIDKEVASLKLISMGGRIDTLTPAQDMYLNSWEHGS